MRREYRWEDLRNQGDWVFHPDTTASQVARLAKRYALRRLPEGSQVVTITVPDGTITFLAYVPPKPEAPPPQSMMPTEREVERRARQQERDFAEMERRNENIERGKAARAKIAEDVEGFDPWDGK